MKVTLIYPPTCDPTAPYLSVPSLTGFLRTRGVEALPIDANIEAYDRLLRRPPLMAIAQRLERRLSRLERQKVLNHVEQLAYTALWQARDDARRIPDRIDDAVAVLRDATGTRFFDPVQYETAIMTVERALRLISAAYTPLSFNFTAYKTPFSLLTIQEIEHDAQPDRNPFHEYFEELCNYLMQEQVKIVGISVAFPGQIQPAYAFALMLRRRCPDIHVTVGGPAMTQILVRLKGDALTHALKPFHSAIIFEGEYALLDLIRKIKQGEHPSGVIRGEPVTDLSTLPAPDFDGLPLKKYLSPSPVLPYDPTRGCYWGKCAFCHYGLAECGTARYRERPVERAAEHLATLASRHQCKIFYLSQDSMSPNMARRFSETLIASQTACRWATDMRPEAALTPECCEILREGGALSMALGIESAAPRVLRLMNKGVSVEQMTSAITRLADAGIAVEAMCFTDFPTETYQEALTTLRFIGTLREKLALFICGQFDLVAGARVAQNPQEYGISDLWYVSGDEFLTGVFYEERTPPKTQDERDKLDGVLDGLARVWWLHRYPWAGSLSTAHTLLWYERYGADVFRRFAHTKVPRLDKPIASTQYYVEQMAQQAREHESDIWQTLIHERRLVTRNAYYRLADNMPAVMLKNRKRLTNN